MDSSEGTDCLGREAGHGDGGLLSMSEVCGVELGGDGDEDVFLFLRLGSGLRIV
jgi:hypothetical protein